MCDPKITRVAEHGPGTVGTIALETLLSNAAKGFTATHELFSIQGCGCEVDVQHCLASFQVIESRLPQAHQSETQADSSACIPRQAHHTVSDATLMQKSSVIDIQTFSRAAN